VRKLEENGLVDLPGGMENRTHPIRHFPRRNNEGEMGRKAIKIRTIVLVPMGAGERTIAGGSYLTAALRNLPALNFGTFDAGIFMAAPVRGLRPVRPLRLETEKVPKPVKAMESPFFKVACTSPRVASRIRDVCALLSFIFLLTLSMNSALVILPPWRCVD